MLATPTRLENRDGRAATLHLQRFALRVAKGPNRGQRVVLRSEHLRMGRGTPNDLALDDDLASRMHAELRVTSEGFRLVDLGSLNGTFLGANRILDVYVSEGDRIRVGDNTLVFEPEQGTVELPLAEKTSFGRLVGKSVVMLRVLEVLERAAVTDATVLLTGETGTGKEEAARAIHAASPRAAGPFVVLDCGSVPGSLLAAELFGHERGAFTGAVETRPGAFERANGGTLLLDEIGELALELQPQLLRVLERLEVQRLGGSTVIPVDVRVLAATNRDLRRDVNVARFRSDLYFRLAVVEVTLPPLRERIDDLPLLVRRLFEDVCERAGVDASPPTVQDVEKLSTHYWPGNIRELRNVIERSVLIGAGLDLPDMVTLPIVDFPEAAPRAYREAKNAVVERFERAYVQDLLRRAGGNVSKAARLGDMNRTHLIEVLKKHGLTR